MAINVCGWCHVRFDDAGRGIFYCRPEHADLDHRRMIAFAAKAEQPLAPFSLPLVDRRSERTPRPAAAPAPKAMYVTDAFKELCDLAATYPEPDRMAGILSRNVRVAAPLERR
jgi:hypothetical protein